MACGQLLNPDGSRQNSFANFPGLASLLFGESLLELLFPQKYPSKRKANSQPTEVDSCIGACLIVRGEAMESVGWLDESYFFFSRGNRLGLPHEAGRLESLLGALGPDFSFSRTERWP